MHRRCTQCWKRKPLDEFASERRPGKTVGYCKGCRKQRAEWLARRRAAAGATPASCPSMGDAPRPLDDEPPIP